MVESLLASAAYCKIDLMTKTQVIHDDLAGSMSDVFC